MDNFLEEKQRFENKKQELLTAIKKATEDKDMLRKDILLKELSENERKFEEIRTGLWGNIRKHPSRISAVDEAKNIIEEKEK